MAYGRDVEVKHDVNSGRTGLQKRTPSLDDVLNQIRGEFLKTRLSSLNWFRECVLGAMNHLTGTSANHIHVSYESHPHRTVLGCESVDII